MPLPESVLAWVLTLALGLALVLMSTYTRGHRDPTAGPDGDRTGAPRDNRMFLACDSLVCGHLERPHDVTTSGLVCSNCGRVVTDR